MHVCISAFILIFCISALSFQAQAEDAAAKTAEPAAQAAEQAPPPAPVPPPPPIPALSVRRELQQNLLLQKWYGAATVKLQTGDGEFIGIWQEDTSGTPVGALLMLHDASQMPDWPGQLQPLRQYLSQHGWATLSIGLPEPDARVLPPRPEPVKLPPPPAEGENSGDGEKTSEDDPKKAEAAAADKKDKEKEKEKNNESAEKKPGEPPETDVVYNDATGKLGDGSLPAAPAPKPEVLPAPPAEPIAQARINAGLTLLKEKKQFNNVLLGVGLGAARAAYFVVQHQADPAQQAPGGGALTPPFQALIFINPQMQVPALANFNLTQAMSNPKLPLLDIDFLDHPAAPDSAKLRKTTARKNKLAAFEQHLVQQPAGSDLAEEQINRIVRGFLVKHAKGVQIQGNSDE